jgi:prolyl oligopeptidase
VPRTLGGQSGRKDWKVHYYENIEGGHGGAADAKQSAFMTALAYDFMFAELTKNIEADN